MVTYFVLGAIVLEILIIILRVRDGFFTVERLKKEWLKEIMIHLYNIIECILIWPLMALAVVISLLLYLIGIDIRDI